jgi:hypothetical protein
MIFSNNAASLGLIFLIESTCIVSGFSAFTTNIGSIFAYNSIVTIAGIAIFINNSYPSSTNRTFPEGGVITAFQIEITRHNVGGSGGMLPQENLDFYISLDRFWCILSALVHKYYDFLETSFVPH